MSEEPPLTIHSPIPLSHYGLDYQDIQRRFNEWLVFSLFTEGQISSGKAAAILHMSRVAFLALLRERGIAYINYTDEELAEEFAAVAALPGAPC